MAEYRDPNKDSDSDSDSFGDALEKHINEHDYDEWTKLNPTFRPEEENGEPEPGGGEPEELTEEDFADAVEMAEKELNQMKINEGEDEEKSKTETENEAENEEIFQEVERVDPLAERKRKEALMSKEVKEELREKAEKLKNAGNESFRNQNHEEAVKSYTEALAQCPLEFAKERSVYLANRAASKVALKQSESALIDCNEAINLRPDYVKALSRRAQIFEDQNKPHEAMADFESVLKLDPDHRQARVAVTSRLPEKIAIRDEEIKAEMFDNLKKLGNMVLNPFGLSTENFQFVKDENTGSYSVNFNNQNKQQ